VALLIDGYNLLYAAGFTDPAPTAPRLAHARLALLDFVARSVPPAERPRTTVVFDAAGAPKHLPRQLTHQEMVVCFAVDYASADDLLEELIRADSAPRRLLVVSSDHRVQRAARRRRASAIDSEAWYREALAKQRAGDSQQAATRRAASSGRGQAGQTGPAAGPARGGQPRPPRPRGRSGGPRSGPWTAGSPHMAAESPFKRGSAPSEEEVAFWLRQFTEGEHAIEPELLRELAGIFPPGYGEDLWLEQQ
jgi:hypothetical protein